MLTPLQRETPIRIKTIFRKSKKLWRFYY